MPVYQKSYSLHTKEKPSKISIITFAILPFYQEKILKQNDQSTALDESIKSASRWFILAQITQNLEFVNLKCITYTQHIWVPLIMLIEQMCALFSLNVNE